MELDIRYIIIPIIVMFFIAMLLIQKVNLFFIAMIIIIGIFIIYKSKTNGLFSKIKNNKKNKKK